MTLVWDVVNAMCTALNLYWATRSPNFVSFVGAGFNGSLALYFIIKAAMEVHK